MGDCLRRRMGVLAVFCLLLCATSGFAQSLNSPHLFEQGMDALTAIGPDRNPTAALDYLRRSADLGYPPAETTMGYFYETGGLVTADPAVALEWYKKAAKQGDRVGEWLLGRLYFSGSGTARDLSLAAATLQKSANQDDPFAYHLLGMVQLEREQYAQAADSFRKAALQGLPQAQQQLGLLLKNGKGVTADKFEAYVWLLVSYDAGNQAAAVANELRALQTDMTMAQMELAKSRARELEQTTNRVVTARGCTGWNGEFSTIPAPPPPEIQRYCH